MVSPGTFSPSLLLLEPFHQNISIQGVDRKISVYNNNPKPGIPSFSYRNKRFKSIDSKITSNVKGVL